MVKKAAQRKKTLAKKVAKLSKIVLAQKPELKYYRSAATSFVYQAGNLIRPCAAISQGTSDVGNRIGDKIHLKNFNIKFYTEVNTAVAFANVRFILFQYKNNPDQVVNTDSTIINLILDSAINNTTYFPMAHYDWDNKQSFRVLKDTGPIMINHDDSTTATAKNFRMNYSFNNNNAEVQYVQNSSSAVSKNELMLLCISNFASSNVSMVYNYQMTYTDA